MTESERTDVAVVIITYNSENEIQDCLEAVQRERLKVNQRIVVLDNQSSDGTVNLIKTKFPEVQLILPKENLGFARGVNRAIRESQSEFILLLNPDTIVKKHAIDKIIDFAKANPNHGLYGGRTLTPEGNLEPSSCWGLPTLWSTAMFAFGLSTILKQNSLFDPESLGKWKRDTIKEVGVITGCFLLAKRSFWQNKLNGFDERFFMYGEDQDLAMRTHALGCKPIICPSAELIHEVGKSSKTPTHKMMLLYKGKACLIRTHWSGLRKTLGIKLLLLGIGLRAMPALIKNFNKKDYLPERYHYLWKNRKEWILGYPPL